MTYNKYTQEIASETEVVLNENTPTMTYNKYTYEIASETEPPLIPTATNEMISLDKDSRAFHCISGKVIIGRTIDIACTCTVGDYCNTI